ncbi:hypothetical protein [Acinetobacter bereziniae]|uniref:hypothetical protein n=1 Tax=Acinetobacter bereziniae TaxID=106648 RepID=UPI003AF69E9C
MDRGLKDEGFIRRSFDIVENEDGRWIGHQSSFNGSGDLNPKAHAALITSTAIYVQHNRLPEEAIEEAIKVKSIEDARKFIDQYSEQSFGD